MNIFQFHFKHILTLRTMARAHVFGRERAHSLDWRLVRQSATREEANRRGENWGCHRNDPLTPHSPHPHVWISFSRSVIHHLYCIRAHWTSFSISDCSHSLCTRSTWRWVQRLLPFAWSLKKKSGFNVMFRFPRMNGALLRCLWITNVPCTPQGTLSTQCVNPAMNNLQLILMEYVSNWKWCGLFDSWLCLTVHLSYIGQSSVERDALSSQISFSGFTQTLSFYLSAL